MSQARDVSVDNSSSAWGRHDLASTSSSGGDNSEPRDTGAQNSNDDDDEESKGSTEETDDAILAEQQLAKLLDRRRRRRENMSRYRRKKKLTVGDMKIKEQLLAVQLHSMLDLHASQSQTYNYPHQWDVVDDDDGGEVVDHRSRHQQTRRPNSHQVQLEHEEREPPTAMDAFVNVLTVKERLREENAALRRNVENYHKFHQLLQETIDEEQEQQQDGGGGVYAGQLESQQHGKKKKQGHQEDHGRWIRFLPNEEPFYYIPLTEFETIAYVTRTLESVYTMQAAYLSSGYRGAHIVTLFDWTASLLLDFDEATQMPVIQYEFKKTFRNSPRTIDELVENEWEIMHSAMYQNLHRVPVKSKVLQRVNENLSVVMWNAPDPEQTLKYRNLSVFSKTAYQDPEGHDCQLVGLTGIPFKVSGDSAIPPPTSVTTVEGEPVMYVTSGFMYTIFSQSPEQQHQRQQQQQAGRLDTESEINVSFGGYALIVNEEQGRFLMVELGSTCVRLEHLLFPFRVLR